MNDCYTTTMLPFPYRGRAQVLHGTWGLRGVYVAITIRIKGSAWVCHPKNSGDKWHIEGRYGSKVALWENARPPRSIRKAAKMALRHFLNR
ncbi:hypothetical protein [Mesoterricola silvestris]|uniref:Uncharacterized protein n=1 Tax=Mesoterricola silvestris TaxID=2927979 RepID=A0AA48GJ83_9BACT|nr:hypothetical protein [Mesoterricola silvestris]BDU72312.1 hypothetical protein METEAL_14860 [Mesoterricola silvestris]